MSDAKLKAVDDGLFIEIQRFLYREAGLLDRRVELFAPVYNEPDEDEITGWASQGLVWAAMTPSFALEMNEAGRTIALVTTPIVIRFRSDVDHRWRAVYTDSNGAHTYEIQGIVNVARRNAQLQLNCREVL